MEIQKLAYCLVAKTNPIVSMLNNYIHAYVSLFTAKKRSTKLSFRLNATLCTNYHCHLKTFTIVYCKYANLIGFNL